MNTTTRRGFLQAGLGLGAAAIGSGFAAQEDLWGGPVVDCHHHLRRPMDLNTAHLDGAGISNALVLARAEWTTQMEELRAAQPGRYLAWFASTDITKPDAEKILTAAVKAGAKGLGELKNHVEAAGPELQRLYALAGELGIPILVHFQEVPHTPTEGTFATGFKNFEAMLKKYPKTKFIGHADAFWANVSADYANQESYPPGKIARGGVTDKLLGDYANLFGDLAANSGNNALSRDPEFTPGFLKRHEDKLIFGSDCFCADGKGTGISQANNPAASRLAGKCVARETLTILKKQASAKGFRKMVWENAHRVYQIKA
jgi:predicted TIM-barrel fold metal-dependent hydrolase